ncbi:glycosyltransferase family 2 protein [Tamlana fucoidanivorans]|uniref:Glycosyltransferase family 2 protein n=1 Tax=Allotamlana fucoidanivorans TaxID=2583814 RepID=A0A5C4SQ94_9FLAO|nr:glycosyltransferase family 2 protein [Tamlana fucoidanivorans]TNJ46466.1 glycosyltransferase family 2 protein [Tamlana fucoidanivorans]
MKTLTVFTPTFNRAYCLDQCYDSLIKQTNQDFIWLIIDDGSSDNTKELVNSWIKEHKIEIQYHYQDNQGMHGAHNTAYSLIKTDLNVCIDSDDFMPNNAVEKILCCWHDNKNDHIAGIIGLDADKQGRIIGSKLPENLYISTVIDLYQKHHVVGDKKLVYRTKIIKQYPPYPIFDGEKFVPLGCLYQLIDQDYKVLTLNEVLCIVEYMPDGSSLNMLKQYRRNPKGFAYSRLIEMKYAISFKERMKKAIHYVSSSLLAKNWSFISESTRKMHTILAIPFGFMLYLYIITNTSKN